MLAMLERLKQAPLAPYPQRRGRVEGTREGYRSVTFYLRHLIWKVLLQLLENPVGASGQAACVIKGAQIRPGNWQVRAASLFSA